MALACEDLAPYGVVLIPPSAPEYPALLADIEQRLKTRPKGSPPLDNDELHLLAQPEIGRAAILLNRASVAIANIAYIWHFRGNEGRLYPARFAPGTSPSVLLPFDRDPRSAKFHDFWYVTLPGSKRLITADGFILGDNTDVRPPAADELWHGGFWSMSSGSRDERLQPLKLTLDGVFFVDGGFAGPNTLASWDQTVFAAEAHLACAALAREVRAKRRPASDFFAQVQTITGQAAKDPDPPPPFWGAEGLDREAIRKHELRELGWRVFSMRQNLDEQAVVDRVLAWSNAPVPRFHKL